MKKQFFVYANDGDPENDITITCHDQKDMLNYARACREQGYTEVITDIKEDFTIKKNLLYKDKVKWV